MIFKIYLVLLMALTSLSLTAGELSPLLDVWKENPDPSSRRSTADAHRALHLQESKLASAQLTRVSAGQPVGLLVCAAPFPLTGLLWQTIGWGTRPHCPSHATEQ